MIQNQRRHILIVDDDDKIRHLISAFLQKSGFIVSAADNPDNARKIMDLFIFDLAVVDVMMPVEDGITFVRKMRDAGNDLPVLMLTALGETENKIAGLSAGVDDYLAKPFDPQELLLRVESILRRSLAKKDSYAAFHFGKFAYNSELHQLKDGESLVDLTETEIVLIEYFTKNIGIDLSRESIADSIGLSENLRGVDVLITRLRKKLESDNSRFIFTVRNVGYKFIA
ncbi:MAG: response regulator transcription factor [Rickettsiales bacterium]|jgi:two-component system phosphate regulon response regulator OmpR|nr:response regulator transcription factor [Rickettsiales bacterium]